MKRISAMLLACAALAAAQDKVTVPLSDPAQPVTVKARLISGNITVTAGSGPQVVVESDSGQKPALAAAPDNAPPGMHRIDGGSRGLTIDEDHNVVTISSRYGIATNLTIQVPMNASVELRTVHGEKVEVTGVGGDIDVENTSGSIELKDVTGAVSAHTVNGNVTAGLARVPPDKPMSFSALRGNIDVTLPADTKARLHLKATNGDIFSDFDVKMEADASKPVVEDAQGQGGRYRIRRDRSSGIYGTINGGGPEYSFQTLNGTILIHKK